MTSLFPQSGTAAETLQWAYAALVEEIVTHPVHVAIEVLFTVLIIYFLAHPVKKSKKTDDDKPTPQEAQELIDSFSSEPFRVPPSTGDEGGAAAQPEIEALHGPYVTIGGKQIVNAATFDFLGMATHEKVRQVAEMTICEYGVGSCGPRGFYGSLKPHLDLEADLAKFLGTHSTIIYSFSFATSSTLIPCFSARGDEILVDEACCLTIQQGCLLSRSSVTTFRHGDMAHLEELMAASQRNAKKKGTLPRRFVITEGVFRNTGEVAKLDEICRLKDKYKFRIILDDCFGFGVLGKSGRGTPEHFDIPMANIEVYVGCMSGALGSVGGFCAGSYVVVDHQRLAATGYVFSASLPPYCSAAASSAIGLITKDPSVVLALQRNAKAFRQALGKEKLTPKVTFVRGDANTANASPLVLFTSPDVVKLRVAADTLLRDGYLVAVATYNHEYKWPATPGLRVAVKAAFTSAQVDDLAKRTVAALNAAFA